jgi:hypothetical protein
LAVFFGRKPVADWINRCRAKRHQTPKVEPTEQTVDSSEDDIEEAVLMDDKED